MWPMTPLDLRPWRLLHSCWRFHFVVLAVLVCLAYILVKDTIQGREDILRWSTVAPYSDPAYHHPVNFNFDPLYPRVPHHLKDHIYYSIYDGVNVYDNRELTGGTTKRKPLKLELQMFQQVQDEAMRYLTTHNLTKYRRNECNDVRYRNLPSMGVELDLLCRQSSSHVMDRVTIVLPTHSPFVVFHTRPVVGNRISINIVLPLVGRIDTLKLFLENLRQVLDPNDHKVGLTVVYFENNESEAARTALQDADIRTPSLETHFLLLPRQVFSRSLALKAGVEESKVEAPIVFLCDVDVLFKRSLLDRCLATPVQGKQVFFPMMFSQFNPELVYSLHGKKVPPPLDTLHVADHDGFWRVWSHGMACLYKTDFVRINGFNPKKTGWGGEDLGFLSKAVGKKYKIVRSLDYGLIHYYHPKDCSEAGKGYSWSCVKIRAMSEASSLGFGLWFFKNKYNSSYWGTLRTKERWEEKVREEQTAIQDGEQGLLMELRRMPLIELIFSMFILNLLLTLWLCWRHLRM